MLEKLQKFMKKVSVRPLKQSSRAKIVLNSQNLDMPSSLKNMPGADINVEEIRSYAKNLGSTAGVWIRE